MESSHNGCPTEILIDLKDNDVSSCVNYSKIGTSFHSQKLIKCLENTENDSIEIKQNKYQCIMDMSPFRLKRECRNPFLNSVTDSKQVLDGTVDDCPTAVLIELPNSSRRLNCNKRDYQQGDSVLKCNSLLQDGKEKEYTCVCEKKCSAIEDSDNLYGFTAMRDLISPPQLRWKTPSPQSMSRISKEASKIIHDLNSSAVVDEDSLLCEEILPISINFDKFDLDENSDEETLIIVTDNAGDDSLSNNKSSVSIHTEQEIINGEILNKEVLDSASSAINNVCISSKYQNSLIRSLSEPFDSERNLKCRESSNESSITSEELKSPEMQSGSFDYSEVFICNKETNDVFIKNSLSYEEKENIQERKDKVLPSKTLSRCKSALIKSMSEKEMKNHPPLKNMSNVKYSSDSRSITSSRKLNLTARLQQNTKSNPKELPYHGKQLLRKTTSVEPKAMPKTISLSNSLHYDSKRESMPTFQKPNSVKQKASLPSEYKSSSSDAFTQMKTPLKRYSIATPLKHTSTMKNTPTPLSSFRNPPVPRFTPQSAGGNRLSFSKSWQQSQNVPNSKGFKNNNFIPKSSASAVTKPSFGKIYSSRTNNQALIRNTTMLSSQTSKNNSLSTTSKKRFCSKLNLPSSLHAEQDRKLARALFPSKPPT